MKRIGIVLLTAGCGVILLGGIASPLRAHPPEAPTRKVLYYVDPMNPAHTSDKPGLAPCGMRMEPVYADDTITGAAGGAAPATQSAILVSPARQQLIGLTTAAVERRPMRRSLRLPGKVVIDETRLYRINATVNGWVTSDLSIAPGVSVKKNQVLATYYSPQLLSAAQSLLHASAVRGRTLKAAPEEAAEPGDEPVPNLNVQQFTESLKNLGMEDHQIEEMIKNRKLIRNVEIISPADGFVLSRNISLGQRFERGTEFYRVADLGHVWILAEVSEADAESLPPGSRVTVTLPRLKKTREATVSSALAAVDPASRTLQLRLEADNPDFLLKPDMFVDLTFELTIPEGTIVPAEAVLRSGLRSAVFVDLGNGRFERRPVVEGARGDDEIQVLSGLGVGERVVVSANFLLDSESRIRNVAGPEEPPATDPVCGMRVDVTASAARSHSGGATWYFCSEQCKRRFEAAPASFLRASSATNAQPRESVAQHSLSGL